MNTLDRCKPARNPEYRCNSRAQFGFIGGMSANLREGMMQSRLWIGGLLLVLSLSVQTASAGPQEDVAAAGQKWATVFADNNPDAMLPFYAKDAVLWGTLSPTIRSDPAAPKSLLRRRLPGVAEGHRQVR